jgi:hypothetical protein
MMRVAFLLFVSLIADAARAAEPVPPCRAHPERIGQCRVVHGRLSVGNGTPMTRIWIVGTRRLLGVTERWDRDGSEIDTLPANVLALLTRDPVGRDVYGNFEVCPFTRDRPGSMQMICVASASRLHVRLR